MIDEITVELDGKRYEWSYDPNIARPDDCWTWHDSRCMKPPAGIIALLNRCFIDTHARDIAGTLQHEELKWLHTVLRSMGACDADFEKPGMELMLLVSHPNRFMERLTERRFERLPPATHTPLNCRELRNWVVQYDAPRAELPRAATCIGEKPFEFMDFVTFLAIHNVYHERTGPTGHVILGREGWEGSSIDSVIDQHRGAHLCIYSQEMFVQMLLCGRDPFRASPEVLMAFKAGHPGLEFVSQGWAGWVHTFVPQDGRSTSRRSSRAAGREPESPLRAMGYKVGQDGLDSTERHSILKAAFTGRIPFVNSHEYMSDWGEPGTPERLKKIANFIASTCRLNKTHQQPSWEAIENWEADLEWLRQEYYRGHFAFHWPHTFV